MVKLGVVGSPSDWLIASHVDYELIRTKLGIELVDIPIDRVTSLGVVDGGVQGAEKIYCRLKEIVEQYDLQGLTLRCFDLLTTVHNTGCIALSKLNDEGIPAACEGDIPTLLTMLLCYQQTGCTGFQVNPARIEPHPLHIAKTRMLFAHCTIPATMCENVALTTHFESGIGVAIAGDLPLGQYTLVKVSGQLDRIFAEDVLLVANQHEPNLCRTQVWIEGSASMADYFLHHPIANHHVLVPGHHAKAFYEILH